MESAKSSRFYSLMERSFLIEWLFAFVMVVLARLPYLLSDHVYFDGDEAVVGIMGRDLVNGVSFPIYFYGQQYGFSLFEAMSCGLFILFLGSSVWSLKLGGMLLFSLGVQRIVGIFRKLNFSITDYFLITFLVVLFPTWIVWGTKLRGGYITAFVAVAFIVDQLIPNRNLNQRNWVVIACMTALVLVAQPFFIIPIFPALTRKLLQCKPRNILLSVLSGIAALVILRLPAYLNVSHWNPSSMWSFEVERIQIYLIDGFWSSFTGFFAFSDIYPVPDLVRSSVIAFSILTVSVFCYAIWKYPKSVAANLILLTIGIALSALPISLFGVPGSRYLIPFFNGILLLWVFILAHSMMTSKKSRTGYLILSILILIPSLSGYDRFISFWLEPQLNDMEVLKELRSELEERQIRHGFVSEWQVHWQMNYLGNGESYFRYLSNEDRIQSIVDEVNQCYLDTACPIALLGSNWPLHEMQNVAGWNERIERINDRFYIMENPDRIYLETGGFELPSE